MTIVIPTVSKQTLLRYTLGHLSQEQFVMRLFVNDITPQNSDSLSNYIEMTAGDYVPIDLDSSSWAFTSLDPIEASHPVISFIFNGAVGSTIYGYYVTSKNTNKLLWSERFGQPFAIAANGDNLKIIPKIRLID